MVILVQEVKVSGASGSKGRIPVTWKANCIFLVVKDFSSASFRTCANLFLFTMKSLITRHKLMAILKNVFFRHAKI